MIEVLGTEGSDEYAAAIAIRDALVKLWPEILESDPDQDCVIITASTKVSGSPVSDIDVVVGARFASRRAFIPTRPLKEVNGNSVFQVPVYVENLLVAVEVKSQDSRGVIISGDLINVRYQGKWKSASDQNLKQAHALVKYFEQQYQKTWVYRCVYLSGIDALPRIIGRVNPNAGAVASGFDGHEFLTAIAGVNDIRRKGGGFVVSSFNENQGAQIIAAPIFSKIVPSQLDKSRMNRIGARTDEARKIAALLGVKRVHISGHGGTGKTVLMLQAAHEAYQKLNKRCLILTFNHALAADISRQLALLGVLSSSDGGGVEVRTAMSFFYAWLNRLGVAKANEADSFGSYESLCTEALKHFHQGSLTDADIETVIADDDLSFGFDSIIVDEAQDWPQYEADLLARLYGGEKIALADGRAQLVRPGPATNWRSTLLQGLPTEAKALELCLRMKKNLSRFANAVAENSGLNWKVAENTEAAGGKVFLLMSDYGKNQKLQERLVNEAANAGSEKIDFLFCVPHQDVYQDGSLTCSKLGDELTSTGNLIWNGVDPRARQAFPHSVNVFRIVQYESCRGLEGWTTVLEGFDDFWQSKYDQALLEAQNGEFHGQSPEDAARSKAWRWSMIPLTRPMDTLVISIRDPQSEAGKLLLRVAGKHTDFIEVLD